MDNENKLKILQEIKDKEDPLSFILSKYDKDIANLYRKVIDINNRSNMSFDTDTEKDELILSKIKDFKNNILKNIPKEFESVVTLALISSNNLPEPYSDKTNKLILKYNRSNRIICEGDKVILSNPIHYKRKKYIDREFQVYIIYEKSIKQRIARIGITDGHIRLFVYPEEILYKED